MSDQHLTDRIFALLERARLCPIKNVPASTSLETPIGNALRCDIAISREHSSGIGTIIVGPRETDLRGLATSLGRALLCRRDLGADHAIICLPFGCDPLVHFLDACADACVDVTWEDRLLDTLARIGVLEPEVAAVHTLTRWLQCQRMNQWTDEVAAAWIDDLQPIAEFRARLLGS